jgi:hypothetical protein
MIVFMRCLGYCALKKVMSSRWSNVCYWRGISNKRKWV